MACFKLKKKVIIEAESYWAGIDNTRAGLMLKRC